MPADGRSERVRILRAEIARIEAHTPGLEHRAGGQESRAYSSRATFGNSLDRLLNGGLARGALHEILAASPGDLAAAAGFVLALASRFAAYSQAPILWISEDFATRENGALYGPGLALYGLDPDRLVVIHTADAKDAFWGLEEALKCRAPAVVVGEILTLAKTYDLTASRRLVLAAQKSGTPCLLFASGLSGHADALSSSAETRFEIRAGPSPRLSSAGGRLPLPGLATWSVRIAKARASPTGIDRTLFRPVLWDHAEASFCDTLSFPLAPFSGDRSDLPAATRPGRQISSQHAHQVSRTATRLAAK
jgi:protein ImuA